MGQSHQNQTILGDSKDLNTSQSHFSGNLTRAPQPPWWRGRVVPRAPLLLLPSSRTHEQAPRLAWPAPTAAPSTRGNAAPLIQPMMHREPSRACHVSAHLSVFQRGPGWGKGAHCPARNSRKWWKTGQTPPISALGAGSGVPSLHLLSPRQRCSQTGVPGAGVRRACGCPAGFPPGRGQGGKSLVGRRGQALVAGRRPKGAGRRRCGNGDELVVTPVLRRVGRTSARRPHSPGGAAAHGAGWASCHRGRRNRPGPSAGRCGSTPGPRDTAPTVACDPLARFLLINALLCKEHPQFHAGGHSA